MVMPIVCPGFSGAAIMAESVSLMISIVSPAVKTDPPVRKTAGPAVVIMVPL